MKKSFIGIALVAVMACTPTLRAQWIPIGDGPDTSYLVIESPHHSEFLSQPLQFAVSYTYDPLLELDGYWLLQQVISFDLLLSVAFNNFGTPEEPSYFVESMTYDGETQQSTQFPDIGPFWQQWVAGGMSGYPDPDPIAQDTWIFGSGMSAPTRLIGPNSTDGWVYANEATAPSIHPVPEPAAGLLLLVGGGLLWLRKRLCAAG